MAQRVLAVIGAVAFVLAAVVVRNAIDDPGDGDGPARDDEVVLVCAEDLTTACQAIDDATVILASARETAAGIVDGADDLEGVDGWITTSAWVEVVESRAPGRLGASTPVAASPTIVAADPARGGAVAALCEGESLWGCLGSNAGEEWGELGHGDPLWGPLKTGLPSADSALGLPVLAAAAAGFFDGTEFASNEFHPTGFRSWLDTLAAPSGRGERSPIATLVTTRGKYTAVGDVRASVGTRQVAILDATSLDATVVVVPLLGGDPLPGVGALREALVAAGWDVQAQPPARLLKPGVMAALHTLWTEVTR